MAQMSKIYEKNLNMDIDHKIEERILSCNPLLEAFGNAKTVRNDNSSRFGKYMLIIMDQMQKRMLGARITKYLLEKSRVTKLGADERNYHVFYHFINGADIQLLRDMLLIEPGSTTIQASNYFYLSQSGCYQVDSINEKQYFEGMVKAFQSTNFQPADISTVWRIISIILLIGNIQFDSQDFNETNNPCVISNQRLVANICKLLQCEQEVFVKSLTYKTIQVQKQIIESPIKQEDCQSNRDTLSK